MRSFVCKFTRSFTFFVLFSSFVNFFLSKSHKKSPLRGGKYTWVYKLCSDMFAYNSFALRSTSKCLSTPSEPMTTTFALVALSATGDNIRCKIFTTSATRFDVIKSKFMFFIKISAINTLTVEVLFNSSSPEPFRI